MKTDTTTSETCPRRFRARRINPGHYEYRGLVLRNHGYYPPDQCVWWEAYNPDTREADYHAHTMRALRELIDRDLNENKDDLRKSPCSLCGGKEFVEDEVSCPECRHKSDQSIESDVKIDPQRIDQWKNNVLPVPSAESLKRHWL